MAWAVSEWGQQPVNAILAAFDVYCPRQSGEINNGSGTNGATNDEGTNNGATNDAGTNNGSGNQVAKNGAEQDRINKST